MRREMLTASAAVVASQVLSARPPEPRMRVIDFGTRPEMIKLWSTLKRLDTLNFDHIMVHTGRISPRAEGFLLSRSRPARPDYQLAIDTSSYGREVADVIRQTDDLFDRLKPDALLILGDTFSGLSVMPAAHRGIKIFHIGRDAGLGPADAGAAQPDFD